MQYQMIVVDKYGRSIDRSAPFNARNLNHAIKYVIEFLNGLDAFRNDIVAGGYVVEYGKRTV